MMSQRGARRPASAVPSAVQLVVRGPYVYPALERTNTKGRMQFMWYWRILQDALFAFVLLLALSVAAREGAAGLARRLVAVLKLLPGAEALVAAALRRQVRGFLRQIEADSGRKGRSEGGGRTMAIPEKGRHFMRTRLQRMGGAGTITICTCRGIVYT